MKKYTCKKYKNRENFTAEKYCAPGTIAKGTKCCKGEVCNEVLINNIVIINDNDKKIVYVNGVPHSYTQTSIETCPNMYKQVPDDSGKLGRMCQGELMQSDFIGLCKDKFYISPNSCGTLQQIPNPSFTIPGISAPVPLPVVVAGGGGLLTVLLLVLLL
jgi:hypothetical protein